MALQLQYLAIPSYLPHLHRLEITEIKGFPQAQSHLQPVNGCDIAIFVTHVVVLQSLSKEFSGNSS